jgi:glycosyltransferase involved in cell wall biosynthesis
MRVLAWPAYRWEADNPYPALLYRHLARRHATEVAEMSAHSLVFGKYDLVHIHWPDALLNGNSRIKVVWRLLALSCALTIARARAPVVWTAHNLSAHDGRFPWLERMFWALLPCLVSHVIVLSAAGQAELTATHPRLGRKCVGIAPHGLYSEVYGMADANAVRHRREQLGVSEESTLVLFFGRIMRYKGLAQLVVEFGRLENPGARLVICGESLDDDLKIHIYELSSSDMRVIIHPGRVPADLVAATIQAADLMVLPYAAVTNSGTALLALSYGCPVIVPALPIFREMRDEVGAHWLRLGRGPGGQVSALDIGDALKSIETAAGKAPNTAAFEWDAVADSTFRIFGRILGRRGSRTGSARGRIRS